MQRDLHHGLLTVMALVLVVSLTPLPAAGQVAGQTTSGGAWTLPRTPDGRPDLRGVWLSKSATPLERPPARAGRAHLRDAEAVALQARADRIFRNGRSAYAAAAGAQARIPSAASIAAGRRIYLQKADCQACHGWAGDGEKMDNQAPDGANLRASQLDRDQLVFVIKCGLPGRNMPAFDRLAYTDDRCLGRTRADLQRMGLELFDPGATLQSREVERLTDFLLAKVIGQGSMDRAKCLDFWDEDVAVCSGFSR